MIMKMVLYLVYFVKLSDENLLNAEMPDIYDLAANVLQGITTKLPENRNFHESAFATSALPEVDTASRSVQKFKKHNAYKNQKGYTFSEVFHNGVKDDGGVTTDKNTAEVIPESRFLYHSLENPLFKSNSLNLQSEDDNELPVISDVHKISNPFESKWIFFPSKGLGKSLGSSTFDFLKKSRGIRNSVDSSPISTSLKSTLNNSVFGNSKLDISLKPFGSLTATAAPAQQIDSTSSEKSFYGYNLEEVKTSDGKTRGKMQIFDKDGLKQNVIYDEKGTILNQTVKESASKPGNSSSNASKNVPSKVQQSNHTPSKVQQSNQTPSKVQQSNTAVPKPQQGKSASSNAQQNVTADIAAIQNTNNSNLNSLQSTTQEPSYWNIHFGNFTNTALPSEEVEYNQPFVNSFATPEYILFNFLGQLSSVPFIPSNENFVTNELSSIDETVDENSFFFAE